MFFYSLEPDLVEFLVRLLHVVLSIQLKQYGGSFFEVTWGLSTGLQCASDLDNLYLDVLDSHVWQSSGGALKCLFWYIDDGFGVLDSRKITVHELQCLLKGWNASIKVPSVETGSPLPFLDFGLGKNVCWTRTTESLVSSSPHFARILTFTTCLEIRTISRV